MIRKIISRLKRTHVLRIKNIDLMELYIRRYRKAGVKIGEKCKIYSALDTGVDAFLLEIGSNVTISGGVKFLMHDNAMIKASHGQYTDILGRVKIGNNCFIGYGTIILPGVVLADDCIVAAGSVVVKSVLEPGKVIGGNPARIIGTTEQYLEKHKTNAINLDHKSFKEKRKYILENEQKLITRKSCDM